MIVQYRIKDYQLVTMMFVDSFIMYALKGEAVIRYIKEGRSGQITLQSKNIEYLEVKPD